MGVSGGEHGEHGGLLRGWRKMVPRQHRHEGQGTRAATVHEKWTRCTAEIGSGAMSYHALGLIDLLSFHPACFEEAWISC